MKPAQHLNAEARAVIYCRVSSAAQLQKGHGNASQETRCREFARMKGYEVVQVFTDDAVSGGMIDRPGIRAMLGFLRAQSRVAQHIVIIDDISRLARDIKAHLELRSAIASAGARLESPSVEFGEDSDSVLVENLLASVSQHQRQKNAEQTRNRMRARAMNGYWPFISCLGYKFISKPGEGRVLVRDEPKASILQEGMEGYASGRFQSQAEVKRFFESHAVFPKNAKGEVLNEYVNRVLTKPLYAGYIELPAWNVPLRKGRHEGLISLETFERIQQRLREGARMPARADLNEDFPLRGAVACSECGKPLTGCWSRSKTGDRHPYYLCFAKGCARKGKAIRRDRLEGEFVELLEKLTPSRRLFDIVSTMFRKAWNHRSEQAAATAKGYEREAEKLDKQITTLLDRIVDASSASVVAAYEKRITELERAKLLLDEKRNPAAVAAGTFDDLFKLAMAFLSNPSKVWSLGRLEYRRLVLKLTFADRLVWSPETGFQTPEITMPFKMIGATAGSKIGMADRVGFEPTVGFHLRRFSRPLP